MPEDRSNKQPPAGDDRNLVVVDEDFVNADTEDRLWLFWERNKDIIVKGTFGVVVGILAFLAFFFWNESRREALGEEFTACQDETARRSFASRHPGEALAAVAMTDVADDLKKAGKFADAAKAYDEASRLTGLAGKAPAIAALGTRARLYAALCRLEVGEASADKAIAAVADDVNAPETLRGFAMLTLANIAVAKGDTAEATKWLNAMDKKLRAGHVWKSDKEALVQSEPSLIAPAAPAAK
jgi:hypothetical protein